MLVPECGLHAPERAHICMVHVGWRCAVVITLSAQTDRREFLGDYWGLAIHRVIGHDMSGVCAGYRQDIIGHLQPSPHYRPGSCGWVAEAGGLRLGRDRQQHHDLSFSIVMEAIFASH